MLNLVAFVLAVLALTRAIEIIRRGLSSGRLGIRLASRLTMWYLAMLVLGGMGACFTLYG